MCVWGGGGGGGRYVHSRCIFMSTYVASKDSILHPDMIHVDAVRSRLFNIPVMLSVLSTIFSYCVFIFQRGCFFSVLFVVLTVFFAR